MRSQIDTFHECALFQELSTLLECARFKVSYFKLRNNTSKIGATLIKCQEDLNVFIKHVNSIYGLNATLQFVDQFNLLYPQYGNWENVFNIRYDNYRNTVTNTYNPRYR